MADNSIGPGEPVKMDGEISVIPAEKDSREVLKNEIGVEFKIKLSDQEVFEAIFMRKVNNGTVVLEVLSGRNLLTRQMVDSTRHPVRVSKHISLLPFLRI